MTTYPLNMIANRTDNFDAVREIQGVQLAKGNVVTGMTFGLEHK